MNSSRCGASGTRVVSVDPAGACAEVGVAAGSRRLAINGTLVWDAIDVAFSAAESELDIEWERPDGRHAEARVVKAEGAALGIEVEPLKPRACAHRCIFCFADQNPPGVRRSLRFKDDDFRLSFAGGNYISATSLSADDLDRIVEQRLSPLYVSVHATRHDLRCRMMGVDADSEGEILDVLRFLAENRIAWHAQVVVCPGWNDGAELDRTLDDLESLAPWMLSVAVVPVGLTAHRDGLTALERVDARGAREVVERVGGRHERQIAERGRRTVLLADEMYLLAEVDTPDYSEDEMTCQIENGVGMVADFLQDWPSVADSLPRGREGTLRAVVMTGSLGR